MKPNNEKVTTHVVAFFAYLTKGINMLYAKDTKCKVVIGDHVIDGIVTKSKKPHKIEITASWGDTAHYEFTTWDNNKIHGVSGDVVDGTPSFRPEYADEVRMLRYYFSVKPQRPKPNSVMLHEKVKVQYNGGFVDGRIRKPKMHIGGVAVRLKGGPLSGKTIVCPTYDGDVFFASEHDSEMLVAFYGNETHGPTMFTRSKDVKDIRITSVDLKEDDKEEGVDPSYNDGYAKIFAEQEDKRQAVRGYAIPRLIELDKEITLSRKAEQADEMLHRIRMNVHRLMNLRYEDTEESVDAMLEQIKKDRMDLNRLLM